MTSFFLPLFVRIVAVNGSACGADSNVSSGEWPSVSAVTSVNGLNDEPGCRCPLVARLNGRLVEVLAADHRQHLAAAVVDRDDRRGRSESADVVGDGLVGGLLEAVGRGST